MLQLCYIMQIVVLSLTDNIITLMTLHTDRKLYQFILCSLLRQVIILLKLFYICMCVFFICIYSHIEMKFYLWIFNNTGEAKQKDCK